MKIRFLLITGFALTLLCSCKQKEQVSDANLPDCQTGRYNDCMVRGATDPTMTASRLVQGLNSITPSTTDQYGEVDKNISSLVRTPSEAARTNVPGETPWFVIWDGKSDTYKAVSLNYIRTMTYDYKKWWLHADSENCNSINRCPRDSSDDDFASTFRGVPMSGDTVEEVDYDAVTGMYRGRISGFEYEDEAQTYDVSLMAAEKEEMANVQKAANLSLAYQINIQTSVALVQLSEQLERTLKRSNGLTMEDQQSLTKTVFSIAGISAAEVVKASLSEKSQQEMINKIADRIGTSATNLENRILPDLLGVEL